MTVDDTRPVVNEVKTVLEWQNSQLIPAPPSKYVAYGM
jgi:hypothetical protein